MGEYSKVNQGPFIEFLNGTCPALLGTTKSDVSKEFVNLENVAKLKQFLGDEQCSSLCITREVVEKEKEEGSTEKAGGEGEDGYAITVDLEVSFKGKGYRIVFVKRNAATFGNFYGGVPGEAGATGSGPTPNASGSPSDWIAQLQIISLGSLDSDCTPFEIVNAYLQHSFEPLFSSMHADGKDEDVETKVGIPNVQKKIAELKMSLLQCQQNTEIEEVNLTIDKDVIEIVEKAKAENRKPGVEEFQMNDSAFINRIQSGVSKWAKEIQKIVKLNRDPQTGSVMQEINFWLGMEKALAKVEDQLKSPEIQLTLDILKQGRKFAALSMEKNQDLKEAKDKVSNYLNLMREFPTSGVNDLLVATSIDQLRQAVQMIFNHMKKIKNASQYPLWRAYNLVEAVSRDLAAQLLKIISGQRLMQQDYEPFEQSTSQCNELFRAWDDEARQFKELVREQQKKRGNMERPVLKINCEHSHFQERISDLQKFRRQHTKLKEVIEKVLSEPGKENTALKEVDAAYRLIEEVDVLDVSRRGQHEWDAAKKKYDERIDHAESEITARLRDRLGAAKTATEMFRVFSRFNALFVRPRIRGAIQEYQATLIQQVKDDIRRLQEKFKEAYETTQACKMATVRDIPPTSGLVIWAKQLERRLAVYMGRVEDVLGRGWEHHVDGKALKEEGDAFAKKMSTVTIFERWLKDYKDSGGKGFDTGMRIFDIQPSYKSFELLVNYDENISTLFKEVRNLQSLQFRVPYAVKVNSDEGKQNYPFAMTLREATRTYMQTCAQITPQIAPMIATTQTGVQQLIQEGLPLKWVDDRIESYTKKLSEQVFQFQHKVTELLSLTEKMDGMIDGLDDINVREDVEAKVKYDSAFTDMQKMIDDMSLASYSNLDIWVAELSKRLEVKLLKAMRYITEEWIKQFKKWPVNGTSLIHDGFRHELKIQNQILNMEPPKEYARAKWARHFHDCLAVITNQPRLLAARMDQFSKRSSNPADDKHLSLIASLEDPLLMQVYDTIDEKESQMEKYVATWLQYQALWEISMNTVLERLGDDLESWHGMLMEIKESSKLFEQDEQEKSFGPIIVDYTQVQAKVKTKHDQWHRDILNEFGAKVGDGMVDFYTAICDARANLEKIDSGSSDMTGMCMVVMTVKRNQKVWAQRLENLRGSQKLLERQRYKFPEDWRHFDQVEGEWDAFAQIMDRKTKVLDKELPNLKAALLHKDRALEENITMLYAEWSSQKPVQGSVKPTNAMEVIKMFDERLQKLKQEFEEINTVKESLQLEVGDSEKLVPLQEEMGNLKSVWVELNNVYLKIEGLKETPWAAVIPKKIRANLEDFLTGLDSMPAKFRQYEAFDHIKTTLDSYKKLNILVADMKTDALKERHWKMIQQKLRITVSVNEMTLGTLWDSNLTKNEQSIREVLTQAAGEMGLEEFLRTVREYWVDFELELVPYKSKCRLIKGWDDLFAQIDEHVNSLQSMKMSPYFQSFAEEGNTWDIKLNSIRNIFDTWMDVQRRWVYLEGIFYSSADIQQLLPQEYGRFKTIDTEFTGIMKKVANKPKILDVAAFEGLQKSLDRISDMLRTVQKALGDYLERQRSQFARFYFVGDEDLLEMIGNSRDIVTVSRHLPKMFAGIAMLMGVKDDPDAMDGMSSREGEEVPYMKNVKISEDPAINAWLSRTELAMQQALGNALNCAMKDMEGVFTPDGTVSETPYLAWVTKYPCQIMQLAILTDWCQRTEEALGKGGGKEMEKIEVRSVAMLGWMADKVLADIQPHTRMKLAQMITEAVHQRDVSRVLVKRKTASNRAFEWMSMMRTYWNEKEDKLLEKLVMKMADASFFYGFEYLGIYDKLVQTALTDRCFLTLTQALHMRMGANPYGPAGTGKTESVKALGNAMARFVLVFCCDEAFDFQAMGRIFVGLCQVGAWGCFDEFNRLEERILSAVSEQILTIQMGLKADKKEIEVIGKQVRLNPKVGTFVTMNPGYAGRSALPDNLKQLFRGMAMIKPDKAMIAQVNLFNQGFRSAEKLAGKIVSLFDLCGDQLSAQPHYDFGLRSLKAVLACAGNLKRDEVARMGTEAYAKLSEDQIAESEQRILLRSLYDTLVPKLVMQDKPLMNSLLIGVFPGATAGEVDSKRLIEEIQNLCKLRHIDCTDMFMEKCMQLSQIQKITHGIMMVGAVGTGKTTVWRTLLDAMEKVDGIKGEFKVVDPKAISKDELYGKLDSTTLEWTDGVFTELLRNIMMNLRGEKDRRQWIMFDGDVDPEWAENLNSVLDDNKLLTLPNGERLAIPPNVRIMFEVETLKYATLATVSRCGMVWFANDVVWPHMICSWELKKIKYGMPEQAEGGPPPDLDNLIPLGGKEGKVKTLVVDTLAPYFEQEAFVLRTLGIAAKYEHVMVFTEIRCITGLFSMIRKGINMIIEYNEQHEDFPMPDDAVINYIKKYLVFSICWAFGGDMSLDIRVLYCADVAKDTSGIDIPSGLDNEVTLLDYEIRIEDGEWYHWKERVPVVEIEPDKVGSADLIISTIDTVRHRATLAAWLEERRPFVLCGPPGSGKTMTLMSTMKGLSGFELASLNFSSGTSPEMLLKTFDLYCEYVKTSNGIRMQPNAPGRWLIVFCDECNLPEEDKYGTQRVIMFIRQITEQQGFYRPSDRVWVTVERVQFLGACNPPWDSGRYPLSDRFLRHAPVILVDYPGPESLRQIYGTFNRGMVKLQPGLGKHCGDAMTKLQVAFWRDSQKKFTTDMQPHYLYSPRELTRWKIALHEAMKEYDGMTERTFIRLVIHEALRIFVDKLVHLEERQWSNDRLNELAKEEFGCSDEVLTRPILFNTHLDGKYAEVEREAFREFIHGKMKVFYEEELSVHLVIFDDVLDHIVRMDRVLRQPLGHLLLVGASGAGKTVLSKFVSWLNGLTVYQLKVGRNYDIIAFEIDVRAVMKRAGVKKEKITFIFDESNALGPAFLERMNALLASGEVPGLFEGDEYSNLIGECKSAGLTGLDDQEVFNKFTKQVQRNLHIVFTMNPANPDFYNRSNSSPALFNRCVIDWFGDWPQEALVQVAADFTSQLPVPPETFASTKGLEDDAARHARLAQAIVNFHESVDDANVMLQKAAQRYNFITPRDFLDFIHHFLKFIDEKRDEVLEQQHHIDVGLKKLKETEEQVNDLQAGLAVKEAELTKKNQEAEQKMTQMVKGQQEAEESKAKSEKLSKELEIQSKKINERKAKVQEELADVEPALIEAKNAVRGVNKTALDEVRNYANPQPGVKMAMSAVILMVRPDAPAKLEWDYCKKAMKDSGFIQAILDFNSEDLSDQKRDRIMKEYTSKPDWDTDKINRASKCAGPVAIWVNAQLKFAAILHMMEPLRLEMAAMEKEAGENQEELERQTESIKVMEGRIQKSKEEYAQLITAVEQIKTQMKTVEANCSRSTQLLADLKGEKVRWSASSAGFQDQLNSLIGDVLLSGAFCTYIGFFDLQYRKKLKEDWADHAAACDIKMKPDMSVIEYLSKPSQRLAWKENLLPDDDLCYENAIIMERFIRYPLVIDPSGQAIKFLLAQFKDKRLSKTSFTDNNFMKALESALRFGTPLLVQDVEKVDPILNSILNDEKKKVGGITVIAVGENEIPFSPTFTMFMTTRDSTVQFTPDLCSRVTFANFTVTQSSLMNQCMNALLKSERPDVDKKRSDLLKLQGEFRVKIRDLEDGLLQALSGVEGSILEDTKVIATLEKLKKESAEIQEQVGQTEVVMEEIKATTLQYSTSGDIAARIFFLMDSMGSLHTLYRYSLSFFFDFFEQSFKNCSELDEHKEDYGKRLEIIQKQMFRNTFLKLAPGMQEADTLVLALQLSQIMAEQSSPFGAGELDLLLKGASMDVTKSSFANLAEQCKTVLKGNLNPQQLRGLQDLHSLPCFHGLVGNMNDREGPWKEFLEHEEPETVMPSGWRKADDKTEGPTRVLQEALIIKALRPDRVIFVCTRLVQEVFSKDFLEVPEFDPAVVIEKETKAASPIMMVAAPGFDPSAKVNQLATETKRQMSSAAMGSPEGFAIADKAIAAAANGGTWVLLKNVHLCIDWLAALEKRFYSMNPKDTFRLFLTMEFSPRLPANLIRLSRVYVFEPPSGVRASMMRSFVQILPAEKTDKQPVERCRLHFLLAFCHAVILERLRYAPVGWSKKYEFSDSDQACSRDVIDAWLDSVSQGGQLSNVSPDKIPWDAIQTVVSDAMYGGRVDNEFDNTILQSFVKHLFCEEAFNNAFSLNLSLEPQHKLASPDGRKREQFVAWCEALPVKGSPAWLGLPVHAERMLRINRAVSTLSRWLKLQSSGGSSGGDKKDKKERRGSAGANPLAPVAEKVKLLLGNLPEKLDPMEMTDSSVKDPMWRCVNRENEVARSLIKKVRNDLKSLLGMCEGNVKATNDLRALLSSLSTDSVPKAWKKFVVPETITITDWISDFAGRVDQLNTLRTASTSKTLIWFGGLFFPEAFLTASRQATALDMKLSLEELQLIVDIGEAPASDNMTFKVSGMYIEGAKWDTGGGGQLALTDELAVPLPDSRLRWVHRDSKEYLDTLEYFKAPVYVNGTRTNLLCPFYVRAPKDTTQSVWLQRSVCITLWTKR